MIIIKEICFLSLSSLDLLKGRKGTLIGGAEVQQYLIARELMKHFKIKYITYDSEGESDDETIDGINVIKSFKRSENRGFLSKLFNLSSKIKEADSDIYYYRSGGGGIIGPVCKWHGKKYIHSVPHDNLADGKYFSFTGRMEKIVNDFSMKRSNLCITQNNYQKDSLVNRMGKDSTIINNGIKIKEDTKISKEGFVLWVGTLRKWKRPHIILELAKKLPDTEFIVIGGVGDHEDYSKDLERSFKSHENIRYLGMVNYFDMDQYYEKASMFLNTSEAEGFPNTFLQCWNNNTPVISMNVDPSDCIKQNKLGISGLDVGGVVEAIQDLTDDDEKRKEYGNNSKKYVKEHHDISKIAEIYRELINEII